MPLWACRSSVEVLKNKSNGIGIATYFKGMYQAHFKKEGISPGN